MGNKQGYFSLVQYSEFPERSEFVNIGIVLLASEFSRVFFRFSDSSSRIKKVFGVDPGVNLKHQIESITERLQYDFSKEWNRQELDYFVKMRTGKIRLSPARSIFIANQPENLVESLFKEFVSTPKRMPSRQRIDTKLRNILVSKEVEEFLHKPLPEPLPFGGELKANYGYQNGSYNLIKGLSLDGDPDEAWEKASPSMTKGRLLYESSRNGQQKRLVAVGDVSEQNSDFVSELENEMLRNNVKFFKLDKMDDLVNDIRTNAGH